jgi:hypothetical protein
MPDTAISPGVGGEVDDIESELCHSSREATVSFVPFAHLDFRDLARKVVLWQTEHDRRPQRRG